MANETQKDNEKAYAFFDCEASKKTIEDYLTGRSTSGQTKSDSTCEHPRPHELGLELTLMEIPELKKDRDTDEGLLRFVEGNGIYATYPESYKADMQSARPKAMRNLRYVLKAKGSSGENTDVTERLALTMNSIYLKFGDKKPFYVALVKKGADSRYMFFDDERYTQQEAA